jgi:hypothetical protein
MTLRDPEYDRFGPWIIEISEADPPPPLFQPYLIREEIPLLSIKIPRKIDRRDARPGMNLYDYMVSLYQERLVILERVGNDVRSEAFFYRDIQCLRHGEHLLYGNLCLSMTGKVYDLPFNTISTNIVQRLVDLIRQRYAAGAGQAAMIEAIGIPEDDLGFFFTRLLAEEKAQYPEFRVLASQTEIPVGFYETGIFRKLLFGVIGKRLLESLHLSDGRELKIINRGKTYRYKGQAVYGIDTFYVPISKIVGATWEMDPKNAAIMNLILDTGGGYSSFAFVRLNPSIRSYARFLSAVQGLPEGSDAIMEPVSI